MAAFNEERHLPRLLRSLDDQTLPPSEVIVVDDGSEDATAETAARHGARVIRLPHRGPALARNAAAETATGEILVFLDGDMACDAPFLDRLTGPIRSGEAVGTYTRDIRVGNPENPWARCYSAIRRHAFPLLLAPDSPERWDNFRAIEKQPFLGVGGYDDVGYGEDRTVARKLGAQAVVAPEATCAHFNPDGLREIFENGRWIGRGHDIEALERPWRANTPWVALKRGVQDLRKGAPKRVLTARLAYHLGITVGYASKRMRPGRHWK